MRILTFLICLFIAACGAEPLDTNYHQHQKKDNNTNKNQVVTPPTVTDTSKIWYQDDYQNAQIGVKLNVISGYNSATGKVAYNPLNQGVKVIKDVMHKQRKEWASGGILNFSNFSLSKGDEIWYQFKLLLPVGSSYQSDPHLKFIRFKTKKANGKHAGYLDLYLETDGDWKLIFEGNYNQGEYGWHFFTKNQAYKPQFGVWETYEIHVVFDDVSEDAGGKARVDFYKNNELVGSATNMQTLLIGGTVIGIYNRTYWNGGVPQEQSWFWGESAAAIKSTLRDDSVHLAYDPYGRHFIGQRATSLIP